MSGYLTSSSPQNPNNAALIQDNANHRSCCRLVNATNKHSPNHQDKNSVLRDACNKQSNAAITKKGANALFVKCRLCKFKCKYRC